jgi:hypothetical protein
MPKRKMTNNAGQHTTQKSEAHEHHKKKKKKKKTRGWSQALLNTKQTLLAPVELLLLHTG